MAQFNVYINNSKNKKQIPYLLDIQNNQLSHLSTRVTIPLVSGSTINTILNPSFTIENTQVNMSTLEIASISITNYGQQVASLEEYRTGIINAIDFMVTGY